jgi:hypothetical protein
MLGSLPPLLLLLAAAAAAQTSDPSTASHTDPLFSKEAAAATTTPDYGTAPPFDSGEPQGPSLGFILGVVTIIVTIFYIIGKQALLSALNPLLSALLHFSYFKGTVALD